MSDRPRLPRAPRGLRPERARGARTGMGSPCSRRLRCRRGQDPGAAWQPPQRHTATARPASQAEPATPPAARNRGRRARMPWRSLIALLVLLVAGPAVAQDSAKPETSAVLDLLPAPAVTRHTLQLPERQLAYSVAAETLPLRDDKGQRTAEIFNV